MFEPTSNPPTNHTPASDEIQLFDVHGHNWRWGVDPDGTPWAVAADVAAGFGYGSAKDALRQLEDDEKGRRIMPTLGGPQEMLVVFEDGLWELVFRSNKPEAKALKRRIKEILHDLRAGRLSLVPQQRLPMSYADALRELASTVEERDRATAQLAEAAPKAEHWDVLASAEGDLSVGDAAKILSRDPRIKTGQNRLFKQMGEMGWCFRQRGDNAWRAYQRAVDNGWLSELPQTHYNMRTGVLEEDAPQVRVTNKGLAELRTRLGGQAELPMAA